MRRYFAAALALLAAAGPVAQAQDRGLPRGERVDAVPARGRIAINANPSALIAAEFAIFRRAQDKGEWQALRESAAAEAVMFVPERVAAEAWIKGRKVAVAAIRYSPLKVWMSCDGSTGVVQGNWRQDEATGGFVTVWQRQEKGGYKWLLKRRDAVPVESDGLDLIEASVASCAKKDGAVLPPLVPEGVDGRNGSSRDNSLHWREFFEADGSWKFAVQSWDGSAFPEVFSMAVAAGSAAP